MESILEVLANDNLLVFPHSTEHDSEVGQIMEQVCKLEDSLKATLNSEEKELLRTLENTLSIVNSFGETERFIHGYRLGALMMMDVFAGRNNVVVETDGR